MKKYFVFFLIGLFAIAACSGCASKWSLAVEAPAESAQWRDHAKEAVAIHIGTITGFKETGTAISDVLRAIAFGNRSKDNTIRRPVAVAIGPGNRLAIADAGRSCVHLYIPGEERYLMIHRTPKEKLRTPVSVAFDDESRLYVSDSTNRAIYVFDRDGAALSPIKKAGDDEPPSADSVVVCAREKDPVCR